MKISELLQPVGKRHWPAVIIIGLGILVYANSFYGSYFPNDPSVLSAKVAQGESARPAGLFFSPEYYSRPVVGFSLAFNYALSGRSAWSYHLFNLIVHLLAALVLFVIIRRTLASKALENYFASTAVQWLALLCSLVWMLHPLQTESVTYISQRAGALAGLFCLLVIYCLIRADADEKYWLWRTAAIAACILGMCSHPVMITVPVIALLYDRAFLKGSFGEAWCRRWPFYEILLLIAGGGLALAVLNPGSGQWQTSWDYAKSQFGVILYYLRLSFWPNNLCLDYWMPSGPQEMQMMRVLPPFLAIAALVAGTIWACIHKPALGFLGAWFFLILAPTSSLVPLASRIAEHRLYLPLAALAVGVILGGYRLAAYILSQPQCTERARVQIRFFTGEIAMLMVAALAILTVQRNQDYYGPVNMWSSLIRKAPQNPRAHDYLGLAYYDMQDLAKAETEFGEALHVDKSYWQANANLAKLLEARGNLVGAIACGEAAWQYNHDEPLKRTIASLYDAYGAELLKKGQKAEAEKQFGKAISYDSNYEPPYFSLGTLLVARHDYEGAVHALETAQFLNPKRDETNEPLGQAYYGMGTIKASMARWDCAKQYYVLALKKAPAFAPTLPALLEVNKQTKQLDDEEANFTNTLKRLVEIWQKNPADGRNNHDIAWWADGFGNLLVRRERPEEAVKQFEQAIKAEPAYVPAHYHLGILFNDMGRIDDAIREYREVLHLNPGFNEVRNYLATLLNNNRGLPLLEHAQFAEAEKYFREATQVQPSFWQAHYNLGTALYKLNRNQEALDAINACLRLNPNYDMAKAKAAEINSVLKH